MYIYIYILITCISIDIIIHYIVNTDYSIYYFNFKIIFYINFLKFLKNKLNIN